MIANYHTHTHRCRHAAGREEEYALAALEAGLDTLGFSDHTPYWFEGDYYSSFRMFPEELPGYVDTVLALRKAYAGRLAIPLGLEAEFYPALFPQMLSRVRDAGIEYLLLGQHFVGNEMGQHYCGRPTADTDILKMYCRQTTEAMYTGLFSYFAHPDLLYYTGSAQSYRQQIQGLCRAAKDCGIALEMNLLGLAGGRHYPNPVFWEIAAAEDCLVVIGRDAHTPQQLLDRQSEQRALALLRELGLSVTDRVALRRI